MNWAGKKVLVTGAGGFIGSHLTERLVELGAHTKALIRYNALGTWGWLDVSPAKDHVEVVAGDIRDQDSVAQAMSGAEVVFHLAALIGIPYSYHAPVSYVRTNIEGTLNVLNTARNIGVECVVHTSTSEVYGTACYLPIDEKHSLQGQSPYAASKIGADKLAEAFFLSFGVPVVTLRPFNTFGPRQSARAIIPTIISQCLNGGAVRLGNMHPTRDFNYVADTVEGFLRAAATPAAIGRTIHIGSGREISMLDLANMIGALTNRSVVIEKQEERVRPEGSEVTQLLADSALARELLGWESSVSLEDGLRLTIEWIRKHLNAYSSGGYVF